MECFDGLWTCRQEVEVNQSWVYGRSNQQSSNIPITQLNEKPFYFTTPNLNYISMTNKPSDVSSANMDLRNVIREKASKHRNFYRSLLENVSDGNSSVTEEKMSPNVSIKASVGSGKYKKECELFKSTPTTEEISNNSEGSVGRKYRQRRQGVYEISSVEDSTEEPSTEFKSVKQLREFYQTMFEKTFKNLSLDDKERTPEKDKPPDLLLPPSSGYCSSSASGASDDEKEKNYFRKGFRRSASSDSAVHSDEESPNISNWNDKGDDYTSGNVQPRSPYSPRDSIDHSNVRSKLLLESQYVALPFDRKFSLDCAIDMGSENMFDSRRESCFSEGDERSRYRYWRTPSVVVSDYSDDIMGLTLEDIEYIRNKTDHSCSCSSMNSSCSNLNYCGSSISVLESDYVLCEPLRKSSNCSSTCSTLSDDEDNIQEGDKTKTSEPSGWRKLRTIVQWTPFFQTYKKQRYAWVQLAGHQGNFKAGPDQGTILKKLCSKEEKCFKILMKDVLRPYVPEYKGLVTTDDGECSYIQLQDLLGDFVSPCVMDCKIGVRTYLEEELAKAKEKPKLRKDMYEKMCQIDIKAPTEEEHKMKGVTKPRYMVWRETISSTATLGFRIEGIRNSDGNSTKDFKTTKSKEQVMSAFSKFTEGFPHAIPRYIQRLKAIKATLESSKFFRTHEMIGSSLLFVHDQYNANVWLIDFAKTVILPEDITIDHNSKWKVGNHEDGYMIGVNNLVKIFMTMLESQPVTITPPLALPETSDDLNQDGDENT